MQTYCPICHKQVVWLKEPTTTYQPFCSKRCQIIDLGAWADGSYSVPTPIKPEDFEVTDLFEGYETE